MRWISGIKALLIALLPVMAFGQNEGEKAETLTNFTSQTQAGRWYIGSDFGVGLGFRNNSLSIADATTVIDASFNPKAGYFLKNKWLVGVSTDISNTIAVLEGQEQYKVSNIAFSPFMRYYFAGGVFAEGMAGIGRGTETSYNTTTRTRDRNVFDSKRYSLGLGISNYWLKRWSFEVLIRYSSYQGDFQQSTASPIQLSGLSVKAGVGVSIGK